jgi:hypothetical protein
MSNICISELTGPQFPAGIRESPNFGPGRYTDPLCTLVGGANSTTTAGCRTIARPRTVTNQDQTHQCNWQCVNTVKKERITMPSPCFLGVFSGVERDGGGGLPGASFDSLFCWRPVYMSHDMTWRKPDRVIASLKYDYTYKVKDIGLRSPGGPHGSSKGQKVPKLEK